MRKLILGILALSLLMIGSVSAETVTLFSDNFDDGNLEGWTVVNSPTPVANEVSFNGDGSGNYDEMTLSIDATNYEDISVSYKRKTISLESDDFFLCRIFYRWFALDKFRNLNRRGYWWYKDI